MQRNPATNKEIKAHAIRSKTPMTLLGRTAALLLLHARKIFCVLQQYRTRGPPRPKSSCSASKPPWQYTCNKQQTSVRLCHVTVLLLYCDLCHRVPLVMRLNTTKVMLHHNQVPMTVYLQHIGASREDGMSQPQMFGTDKDRFHYRIMQSRESPFIQVCFTCQ
jgi:hypothetical protein